MKIFNYVVKDPVGMHARPASKLVQELTLFKSQVKIELNGKTANAKSIINLMSLSIKFNDEIKFQIEGDDEEELFTKLPEILANNKI